MVPFVDAEVISVCETLLAGYQFLKTAVESASTTSTPPRWRKRAGGAVPEKKTGAALVLRHAERVTNSQDHSGELGC